MTAADRIYTARRLRHDGTEEDVPLKHVQVGDRLRVRPGEKVPVDGIVRPGSARRVCCGDLTTSARGSRVCLHSPRSTPQGGSQCPWIGFLESSSTSSLTMRMAGPGIRVRVAPLLCVSSHSKGLSCRPRDARAARSPSAPQHIPESTTGGTPWEHIVF